jgi:hypothetical protein
MPDDLPPTFAKPLSHEARAGHSEPRRVENMMTSVKTDPNAQSQRRRDQEIDARYGAIGIAAVAAAVRYQSIGKTKATAPASPQGKQGKSDRAA